MSEKHSGYNPILNVSVFNCPELSLDNCALCKSTSQVNVEAMGVFFPLYGTNEKLTVYQTIDAMIYTR